MRNFIFGLLITYCGKGDQFKDAETSGDFTMEE
jgi:hypothetical protein